MVTKVTAPAGPAVSLRRGSLLDTAQVVDDFKWQHTQGVFDSYNCMKFDEGAEFCGPNEKDLDQVAAWINGFRFAAYGGVVCKAIGLDEPDQLAEVTAAFTAGESTAVEQALMLTRFVESEASVPDDLDAGDLWIAPVDITPAGGAVTVKQGVALLEGFASREYVGVPTLHLPISVASLLSASDGIVQDGTHLSTHLGSKVVAGAGYDFPNTGPDGTDADDGERWLYATGEVLVMRGEVNIRQSMEYSTNEVFLLAERPYIVAVDCFAAAIRVTVE